jgi:hypothetical protein
VQCDGLDEDGPPIGNALDAVGGKYMIRLHANNARQSDLTGGMFGKRQPVADTGNGLKRPLDTKGKASKMAEIIAVDPATVWPNTLGKTFGEREELVEYIKNDIRSLF